MLKLLWEEELLPSDAAAGSGSGITTGSGSGTMTGSGSGSCITTGSGSGAAVCSGSGSGIMTGSGSGAAVELGSGAGAAVELGSSAVVGFGAGAAVGFGADTAADIEDSALANLGSDAVVGTGAATAGDFDSGSEIDSVALFAGAAEDALAKGVSGSELHAVRVLITMHTIPIIRHLLMNPYFFVTFNLYILNSFLSLFYIRLPSVYKSIHSQARVNFVSCIVAFISRTPIEDNAENTEIIPH